GASPRRYTAGRTPRLPRAHPLLTPPVERPLLDPLGTEELCLRQDPQVLTCRGLADTKLLRDEQAAHAVLDEVAIDLGWEVGARLLEPVEDLQSLLAGQRLDDVHGKHLRHFAKWLIVCQAGTP